MAEIERPRVTGVTPYLTVHGAADAIEFYKRAFGATEVMRLPADDGKRLMHAHIRVNGADVFMCDDFPEYGNAFDGEAKGVTLHLSVDDADAWFERAVAAGAKVTMPLSDQFWGDRFGQVRDPFGHSWSIGAPIEKG
jgi:PhnB protein